MGEEVKILAANRRARFDYHILDTFEAGMVLTGAEIKSMRLGEMSISEAYVRPQRGELFLLNAHIQPYSQSGDKEYDPLFPLGFGLTVNGTVMDGKMKLHMYSHGHH